MNILAELKSRFAAALAPLTDETETLVELVRRTQDPTKGDYQANCAMPLGKKLGKNPREVAEEIVANLPQDGMYHPPEVAGPGFINLRLQDAWLAEQVRNALKDERLGVPKVETSRKYIIDFSSPNVAKPMHVGHIRSTVIGDALARVLGFLGHEVITDNHIGDWGTQFGMIIYGYRHFLDNEAYLSDPVHELARLYRFVRKIYDYYEGKQELPELKADYQQAEAQLADFESQKPDDPKAAKKHDKEVRKRKASLQEKQQEIRSLEEKLTNVEQENKLFQVVEQHPDIREKVLEETAKLHSGDSENLALWKAFLPPCLEELNKIYRRLDIEFDYTLGESFYHDMLGSVVQELLEQGVAEKSQGAVCIFFAESDVPMLIQKKDGAFLYGTTDLATIRYRMEEFQPDAMLYVVDHRQSLHFDNLFAATRRWGYQDVELQHIKFGTVLGPNKRPYKTREGDTVGLESLLDEAVATALKVVTEKDESKPDGPELSEEYRQQVAEAVGLGAIKYADLSHNRESDYVFDLEEMISLKGNTATYMQYAYVRPTNILAKADLTVENVKDTNLPVQFTDLHERSLAIELLGFSEALEAVTRDYRPNLLTNYLWDLCNTLAKFYDKCPVLKAETEASKHTRLVLCALAARTIRQALALLGIKVLEKM